MSLTVEISSTRMISCWVEKCYFGHHFLPKTLMTARQAGWLKTKWENFHPQTKSREVGERGMLEANFSLRTNKQQVAFGGSISNEWLVNLFVFEEKTFITRVKILLGSEYLVGSFRYQNNLDIVSLFMAWCLELESQRLAENIVTKMCEKGVVRRDGGYPRPDPWHGGICSSWRGLDSCQSICTPALSLPSMECHKQQGGLASYNIDRVEHN